MASRRPATGYTLFELLLVLALLSLIIGLGWPAMRRALIKAEMRDAARQVRVELAKARLEAIRRGTPMQFRFQLGGRQFLVGPLWASSRATLDQTAGTLSSEVGFALADGAATSPGFSADVGFSDDFAPIPSASLADQAADGTRVSTEDAGPLIRSRVRRLPEKVFFADPRQERFQRTTSLSPGVVAAARDSSTGSPLGVTARLDQPGLDDSRNRLRNGVSPASTDSATSAPLTGSIDEPLIESDTQAEPIGEWSSPVVFRPNGQTENLHIRLRGPRGYQIDLYLRGLTGEVHIGPLRREVLP
ncbi:MAG: hypothetical protein GXP27_14225 [Planctomycetes bacterium]|nr:hypothetical protein [Planctomycetota bacterium]